MAELARKIKKLEEEKVRILSTTTPLTRQQIGEIAIRGVRHAETAL